MVCGNTVCDDKCLIKSYISSLPMEKLPENLTKRMKSHKDLYSLSNSNSSYQLTVLTLVLIPLPRSKITVLSLQIILNGSVPSVVKEHKILGLTFDSIFEKPKSFRWRDSVPKNICILPLGSWKKCVTQDLQITHPLQASYKCQRPNLN